MTRDLSLRGMLSQWARDVLRFDGRLPRSLGRLLGSPGVLTRAELAGERHGYSSPLQLYLVANLAFFLIGPAMGLFNFRLDGFLGVPVYRELVDLEIQRLGISAQVYQVSFDTVIRFRQPTFVFLLVPGLAAIGKAMHPRRLFGEHLIYATDFFAWLLLMAPALMILARVLAIFMTAVLGESAGAVVLFSLVPIFLGVVVWYVIRSLATVFGLTGVGLWARAALVVVGLVGLVAVYAQFLFWSTVLALYLG